MTEEDRPLTDGVVSLRPDTEADVASRAGNGDGELGTETGARMRAADSRRLTFAIHADGATVGGIELQPSEEVALVRWWLSSDQRGRGYATRAARLLVEHAFTDVGVRRVEAQVDPRDTASQRVATRAGLRREGLRRLEPGMTERPDATGLVIYARLASDPSTSEPEGFRALLNSFLPRKRAISQLLVRDHDGRVLICRLTYKNDWDLPGGVVEVGESPRLAAAREIEEELALQLDAGPLLLTDWLPPWSGWDDAVCLVFDGGAHPADLTDGIVKQAREIREAEFATLRQVRERCADFTARRIESALANLTAGAGPAYVESGR